MSLIKTARYEIDFKEISEGGAGGYESTYLTTEGKPAEDELYKLLKHFVGTFLPANYKVLRQREGKESVLADAVKYNKMLGIASGFKPSGACHFGHMSNCSTITFFQKNGTQLFIPVADLECMLDSRKDFVANKQQNEFWEADNLLDWGANGVNLDAAHVYLQSEEFRVSNIAYLLARGLTFDLPLDIYGFKKLCGDPTKAGDKGEFPFLFAGMTQVADIVLPQHSDFGNYHSFMVSGQDQDGHMKMTVELVMRAFNSNIVLPGIRTIPSGLYIPHIRGFKPKDEGEEPKMSSSWPEGTLYLGSGAEFQTLDERVKTSLQKLDSAYSDGKNRENVERCALDLVMYIEQFNSQSSVDFSEVCQSKRYRELIEKLESAKSKDEQKKVHADIDNYLISICKSHGQDNVELVRDSLKSVLTEHQKRRALVLKYALERAEYDRLIETSTYADGKPLQPDFWEVPQRAVVDEAKRNKTKWYNLVYNAKDKLQP